MSHIERSVTIAAEAAEVWAVLADLDRVVEWNPNVTAATCGERRSGVGATRTCQLAPRGRIDEVVSEWREQQELWFAVGDHGAVRSADMGFVLDAAAEHEADDSPHGRPRTTVTAIADYHLALGPLGPVIDHLTVRRLMARMLDAGLAGLKAHLEATPELAPETHRHGGLLEPERSEPETGGDPNNDHPPRTIPERKRPS